MKNFEIKAFANISGFDNSDLFHNSSSLFTDDLVKKRNFDAEDTMFNSGAYSVFYTPDAYVVSIHFNVTSEAKFRAKRAHLAIAIRRGWKINGIAKVLESLSNEFVELAAIHKGALVSVLSSKLVEFNSIVEAELTVDEYQQRINALEINTASRAVATYTTSEEKEFLLENVNRPEFKNYSLVFVIPNEEAQTSWNSLKTLYSPIKIVQYKYIPSYRIVFPDSHVEVLDSLDAEINYTCKKRNYTDKIFKGKLREHMVDWEIKPSLDYSQYTIGISLEPERKEFGVLCVEKQSGQNCPLLLPKLKFTHGKLNTLTGMLVLTGDEIDQLTKMNIIIEDNSGYSCSGYDFSQDGQNIIVYVLRMYKYNFKDLLFKLKEQTDEDVTIRLYDNRKKSSQPVFSFNNELAEYTLDLPYEFAVLRIPATVRSKEAIINLNPVTGKPQPYNLIRADYIDIRFKIKNSEVVKKLEEEKIQIICKYSYKTDLPEKIETFQDSSCCIKNVPSDKKYSFKYTLSVKGYKIYSDEYKIQKGESGEKIVDVTFEKKGLSKYGQILGRSIPYLVILMLGIFLGVAAVNLLPNQLLLNEYKSGDAVALRNEKDSLNGVIANLRGEILLKDDTIKFKTDTLNILRTQIQNANDVLNGKIGNVKKGKNSEAINNGENSQSSEIDQLVSKLRGIEYTEADIDRLKKLDANKAHVNLILSAQACLKLCNIPVKEKPQINDPKTFVGKAIVKPILDGNVVAHIEFLKRIQEKGEFSEAYASNRRRNYQTVREAQKTYSGDSSND